MHADNRPMIVRKTPAELEKMRQSGLLVWNVLKKLGEMAVEGVSTLDLEIAAEKMIADAGARPAFKGYFVPSLRILPRVSKLRKMHWGVTQIPKRLKWPLFEA